ncbi:hypothetical protein FYK55_12040 [Roseiconus nitratireducens]|uniref:Uncharacterized protein n=1 Tax=Roseiconus nitratireducens TaxID=2605748 RepID=A0A5M6D9R7_9BACT|nr:hypothetical protein [Roseiconus nitratireducens]KAA5543022.1 hypothetical protein FYK55_12040 [Roseiconus nitratireducens]
MNAPKKPRSLLKRIAVILGGTAVVLLGLVALWIWNARRSFEAQLEPLREDGKPVSLKQIRPEDVPESENAAVVLAQRQTSLQEFDRRLAEATAQTNDPEEIEAAGAKLASEIEASDPELVPAIRELAARPVYQPGLDYTLPPAEFMQQVIERQSEVRTAARLLQGHGLMLLANGQPDQAAADAIAIVQWSDLIGGQPLLVNGLTSFAVRLTGLDLAERLLYQGGLSPEVRQRLVALVGDEQTLVSNFQRMLDTERAFGIDSYRQLPSATIGALSGDVGQYLKQVESFQSLAADPSGLGDSAEPSTGGSLSGLSWSALHQGIVALRRVQAKSRALSILSAWQSTDPANELSVESLSLSPPTTTDPFNGKPMKLVNRLDSLAVYSVGENLTDDGGDLSEGEDVGVAPGEDDTSSR